MPHLHLPKFPWNQLIYLVFSFTLSRNIFPSECAWKPVILLSFDKYFVKTFYFKVLYYRMKWFHGKIMTSCCSLAQRFDFHNVKQREILSKKMFRQISSLVSYFWKPYFDEISAKNACGRENARNFHTVMIIILLR